MAKKIISLGKAGLLSSIHLKINYAMCCYFYSKYSQSTLYLDNITSLTKDLQINGNDAVDLKNGIQKSLQLVLGRSFEAAEVEVTNLTAADDPGIKLQINAIVSEQGSIEDNSVSVGYSIFTKNSTLKELIDLSNGRVMYSS